MTGRSARGFTLLELCVVLLVILALLSMFPFAIREVENTRYITAQNDAVAMAGGILGTRDKNGTLGDLGYLPTSATLSELGTGRPNFALRSNERGVTFGWHGPYAISGVGVGGSNPIAVDAWNNAWQVDANGGIFSVGSNGVFGGTAGLPSDDIQAPSFPLTGTQGWLLVNVLDFSGRPLDNTAVQVEVSNPNPTSGLLWPNCDATPNPCIIDNLFQGQHVVRVSGRTGTEWENARGFSRVYVGGGTRSAVTVRLSMWQAP